MQLFGDKVGMSAMVEQEPRHDQHHNRTSITTSPCTDDDQTRLNIGQGRLCRRHSHNDNVLLLRPFDNVSLQCAQSHASRQTVQPLNMCKCDKASAGRSHMIAASTDKTGEDNTPQVMQSLCHGVWQGWTWGCHGTKSANTNPHEQAQQQCCQA